MYSLYRYIIYALILQSYAVVVCVDVRKETRPTTTTTTRVVFTRRSAVYRRSLVFGARARRNGFGGKKKFNNKMKIKTFRPEKVIGRPGGRPPHSPFTWIATRTATTKMLCYINNNNNWVSIKYCNEKRKTRTSAVCVCVRGIQVTEIGDGLNIQNAHIISLLLLH